MGTFLEKRIITRALQSVIAFEFPLILISGSHQNTRRSAIIVGKIPNITAGSQKVFLLFGSRNLSNGFIHILLDADELFVDNAKFSKTSVLKNNGTLVTKTKPHSPQFLFNVFPSLSANHISKKQFVLTLDGVV